MTIDQNHLARLCQSLLVETQEAHDARIAEMTGVVIPWLRRGGVEIRVHASRGEWWFTRRAPHLETMSASRAAWIAHHLDIVPWRVG